MVIGEGEKDDAPMLYNGERIGTGNRTADDIAVDPIDGTTFASLGRGGALAVIALAERGSMFDPGPCFYMDKIAAGPGGGQGRRHRPTSPPRTWSPMAKASGARVRAT